jgi:phosphoribosylaminoimidazole-succinocarboxamide synthase
MTEVKLDREHSYRLIDENWFLVTYRWFEGGRDRKRNAMVYDVVSRDRVRLNWGANQIAVAKRSCSHDEIVNVRERIADWEKQLRRM